MDLKGFKKVSEDETSATFQNRHGHQIKIAKKNLKPELLEELKKLPLHKSAGGPVAEDSTNQRAALKEFYDKKKKKVLCADGDPDVGVSEVPVNPTTSDQPEVEDMGETQTDVGGDTGGVRDMGETASGVGAEKEQPDVEDAEETQTDVGSEQEQPEVEKQPTFASPVPPSAQVASPVGTPDQKAQEHRVEDVAVQNDLTNGNLTPKTYKQLMFMNEDGTPKSGWGKLASVFGMIMSGAGAGLAHQPNMLMQIMNNEIQNDLEAQKQSKINAQNLYRLSLAQQMQKANIKHLDFVNGLTQAQQGLTEEQAEDLLPAQADAARANKGYLDNQAAIEGDKLAHVKANRFALHSIWDNVDQMPPGSQKDAALRSYAMVAGGVDQYNSDLIDQVTAKDALGQAIFGVNAYNPAIKNAASADPEGEFKNRMQYLRLNGMESLAKDQESKHIAGIWGGGNKSVSDTDRDNVHDTLAFKNKLDLFRNFVANHSGEFQALNPTDKNVAAGLVQGLQQSYRGSTFNTVYRPSEKVLLDNVISADPMAFWNKYRVDPSLAAINQDALVNLDHKLKENGFSGGIKQVIPQNTQGLPALPSSKSQPQIGGRPATIQRGGATYNYDAKNNIYVKEKAGAKQ